PAFDGGVNSITRDLPVGVHGRARATGGWYANPPSDVWRFRDATGGLGGVDLTGSYGTEALRGALTLGGRHSDGYREQDASDQWETAGRAEWLPAPGTRVTASGAWTSHQYEVFPTWCGPGQCDLQGQAFQPFRIDTSSRGSYTRSDKGYLFATLERTASSRFAWMARGSWRASVGRGFRAPTLAERWVTTQAFGFQVIPNPALSPETAWSFELGDLTTLSSWGRLDAALFWTETRRLLEPSFVLVVDSTTKDTVQKIQIQNVSRARLRGLDASLTVRPIPPLTGTIAYLFLDAR